MRAFYTFKYMKLFFSLCIAQALCFASTVEAQIAQPGATQAIAPLAGPQATKAAGQQHIGFYGTDLGFTMLHNGQLRIVFGDSWAARWLPSIGPVGDDAQGTFCLSAVNCPSGGVPLATGDDVTAYADSRAGREAWERPGPPIVFRRNALGLVAPIAVHQGGASGPVLDMGILNTPVAVFGNGLADANATAYGIFIRDEAVACESTCASGWACDKGWLGVDPKGAACKLGVLGCTAPSGHGGICVDAASPRWDASADGRLKSAVTRLRVGSSDAARDEVYYTQAWDTHRFRNLSAAAATTPDGKSKVYLWGYPWFMSTRSHPSRLYFAMVDMPAQDPRAGGSFEWKPRFYAGQDASGQPRFSERETDAAPLQEAPAASAHSTDVLNQISVRFVPQLGKWVMLFGGDIDDELVKQEPGLVHDPQGAIKIRFASQAWGPWSAPQVLFEGGNLATARGGAYEPGGILHSPHCKPPSRCIPGEPLWNLLFRRNEPGHLYGANLIPEWTVDGGTSVDLFWNVSTWAPYQVFLMRSTIAK